MKVLFLNQPHKVRMYPAYEAFVQAIAGRYEVALFDRYVGPERSGKST